jgi:DNA-binding transcriptional MocR family regulator
MLKRIVMQLSGLGTDLSIRLWGWLTTRLWKPVSSLPASFTRKFQSAINLLNPLAQMLPNFKAWRANQITAAQSTKQEPTTAKAKVIPIGSRRQTTAPQTRQAATTASKKNKEPVGKIKLVLSRISENKTVQTLIAHQWTQAGLRLLGTARQHLQRVQRRLFKGR